VLGYDEDWLSAKNGLLKKLLQLPFLLNQMPRLTSLHSWIVAALLDMLNGIVVTLDY